MTLPKSDSRMWKLSIPAKTADSSFHFTPSARKLACSLMRLGLSAENVRIVETCFEKDLKEVGVDIRSLKQAERTIREAMDHLELSLGMLSYPQEGEFRDKFPHLKRHWSNPPESKEPENANKEV